MNTFKSAFYSLSAATLLSSSAFAADAIEVRLSKETAEIINTKDQLATKGGEIYLIKIGLDNDADFATMTQVDFNISTANYRVDYNPKTDLTCTGEDNKIEDIDTSIIKNFVIYEGSVASINKVGIVPFSTSTHASDATQITASFKDTDVVYESGKDLDFTNTNSAATVYLIGLEYGDISQQVKKGEINIALDSVYVEGAVITATEDDLEISKVKKTVAIDSVSPAPFHEYANTENGLAVDSYDAIIEQVETSTETNFFSMPQLDYLNTSTAGDINHSYVRHYNDQNISDSTATPKDTDISFGDYTLPTSSVLVNAPYNTYKGNETYTSTTAKEDLVGDDIRVIVRLNEELSNDFCSMNSKYEENLSQASIDNNITILNDSFTFTDTEGNPLTGIKSFSCYNTCLSQKRLDPGEAKNLGDLNVSGTELHFTVNPTISTAEANTCDSSNTIAVGDVTISYAKGLLKDSFDNLVEDFSGVAYKDQRAPVITGVEVDVETNKKGKIVFDEPINMVGTFADIIKAGTADDFNKTNGSENRTEAYSTPQTLIHKATNDQTIDFEASSELSNSLYITFIDSGITDKEANAISPQDEPGEFGSKPLGVYIVPNRWNLISIPSCQATTSKRLSQSGTVQTIWGYDNNEWTKSPKKLEAGQGYWVKTLPVNNDTDTNTSGALYNTETEDAASYDSETNNIVTRFYNVQTTGYNGTYVNSESIIENNSDTSWKLLGIDKAISWSNAHSQVQTNCSTVSIFQYSPLGDASCATGNCGAWNAAPYIPSYSGVWVRQENCD